MEENIHLKKFNNGKAVEMLVELMEHGPRKRVNSEVNLV